jgi:hypothetical protein
LKAAGVFADQFKRLDEASKAFRLATGLDPNLPGLSAASEAARLLQTSSILDSLRGPSSLDRIAQGSLLSRETDYLSRFRLPRIPLPPDPESYDDWPPRRPVTKGALTCDLWRHQSEEEMFVFEVLFTKDGEARGIVECTVHAENLTKPEQGKAIVGRRIEPLSMVALAEAMGEDCK